MIFLLLSFLSSLAIIQIFYKFVKFQFCSKRIITDIQLYKVLQKEWISMKHLIVDLLGAQNKIKKKIVSKMSFFN